MDGYQHTQEGTAPFAVAKLETPCQTYYKIFGDLSTAQPPILILHGGPGATHRYCLPFSKLWELYRIPVVLYDQLGCGASTHLPQTAGDQTFWTVDLFVAELENLVKHLGLDRSDRPGYHVLGHSWGGRLAAAFAARQPPGLQRLVLASAAADSKIFFDGLAQLKKQLSVESQKGIDEAIRTDDFTTPAYLGAMLEFSRAFLCHADPWPSQVIAPDPDSTVRRTLQGRSPWAYTGTLQTYSSIPYLSQIKAPTLVYNGEFDTTQYEPTVPWFNGIPKVRWVTLSKASHMPHLDSEELLEKTLRLVGHFLQPAVVSAD